MCSASTDLYAIDNFSMCVGEMPVTAVQGCIDNAHVIITQKLTKMMVHVSTL